MRLRVVAALAALVLGVPAAARAAPIAVTTTGDGIGNDGRCSLREAISAANRDAASGGPAGECPAGAGGDTVLLRGGHYGLFIAGAREDSNLSGDLDARGVLTIHGAGAAKTMIDARGID